MSLTGSEVVFACYSKACAPPPAGKGGSTPGGAGRGAGKHRVSAGHSFYKPKKGSVTQVMSKMMTKNSAVIDTATKTAKVSIERQKGLVEGWNFKVVSMTKGLSKPSWREQSGGVKGSRTDAINKVARVIDGTEPVASRKVRG